MQGFLYECFELMLIAVTSIGQMTIQIRFRIGSTCVVVITPVSQLNTIFLRFLLFVLDIVLSTIKKSCHHSYSEC